MREMFHSILFPASDALMEESGLMLQLKATKSPMAPGSGTLQQKEQ